MKNQNKSLLIGLLLAFVGISGGFSVLFGAWLAHAGQSLPTADLSRLRYAHLYQFIHTVVLLVTLLWYMRQPVIWLKMSAIAFAAGIILFSGSLYLKTFLHVAQLSQLAPIGGITLAIAWLFITPYGVSVLSNKYRGEY